MNVIKELENKKLSEILLRDLTKREVEILSLYVTGSSAKKISEILSISKKTVENHINNIVKKIDIEFEQNRRSTLCLFYSLFRKDITKMGGYKIGN